MLNSFSQLQLSNERARRVCGYPNVMSSSDRLPATKLDASDDTGRDRELYKQIEATTRRVKRAIYYSGSKTTGDFVQSLVEKWLGTEEYHRLLSAPAASRFFGPSVRAFVIDEIRRRSAAKRQGTPQTVDRLVIPSDELLEESVAQAQVHGQVLALVAALRRGEVDDRAKNLLISAEQSGEVLAMTIDGRTNAEIAASTRLSAGTVSNRLHEGIAYLSKLVHRGRVKGA